MEGSQPHVINTSNENSGIGEVPVSQELRFVLGRTEHEFTDISRPIGHAASETCSQCAPPLVENNTDRCMLLEMPPEILVHIMRYLIGPPRLIQVLNSLSCKKARKTGRTVHQRWARGLCCAGEQCCLTLPCCKHRPSILLSSVASTCRLLNDAWNTVFYGGNKFVLELGKFSLLWGRHRDHFSISHDYKIHTRREFGVFESHTIWPLTKHTFEFVKDLTVIYGVRGKQLLPNEENEETKALFQQARDIIALASSPNQHLRRLAVYLDVLHFQYMNRPLGFEQGQDGSYRIVDPSANGSPSHWNLPKLRAWWRLWTSLEGRVREVHLGGVISDELKNEIEAALVNQSHRARQAN